MQLPNVWDVCTFSDEIVYGKLDMSKFAVELHSVLDGTADEIYKNPKPFLNKTFLTTNMKYILKDALLKISKDEGQPVYIIDTEFGGGKTHTLLLLYHVFGNPDLGSKYIRKFGLDRDYGILEVPNARVVALDCTMVKKNTLWGEIATLLGKYDEVKELDEGQKPIMNLEMLKSFFDKPTLLLIDELPMYLLNADSQRVGNITLAELTVTFIQNLIRAVSSVKNCMLILTLTATQRLYEKYAAMVRDKASKRMTDYRVDEVSGSLKEAMSRQAQFIVPLNREEIYDVIVTRLVKKMDQKGREKTVQTYYTYYEEKALAAEPNYRDKMLRTYPFHPFLIDVLYERVSTIDEFNKTRGLLRLLALIVHNIYRNKVGCRIVGLDSVDLANELIMDELTSKIGKGDFRAVINSDCITKAREMDRERNVKLVESMATAIYIYSLIGATKISGMKPSELKLSVCQPGIDPSLVDRALEEIDKEFWFIRSVDHQFYFDKKPNINKVIEDYMREVKGTEVKEKIKEALSNLVPSNGIFSSCLWDVNILTDDDKLKIFVVDHEHGINDYNAKDVLGQMLEHNPNGSIRTYQNTMVFLYPDPSGVDALEKMARRVSATEKAAKDDRIKMDRDEMKKAKERYEDYQGQLEHQCANTYSKVGYPYAGEIRFDTISMFGLVEKKGIGGSTLTVAVTDLLKKKGKLVEKPSVDAIEEMVDKITVKQIYENFRRDRSRRFVTSASALLAAVKEGVAIGVFGYAKVLVEEDGKYRATIGKEVDVSWDGWLIRKDLVAEDQKPIVEPKAPLGVEGISAGVAKPAVYNYRYVFNFSSIDDIEKNLAKIHIATLNLADGNRTLHVVLENDNGDRITIDSMLRNINEIRSLLNQLKMRYRGRGTVNVESETDLDKEFNKVGMKPDSGDTGTG